METDFLQFIAEIVGILESCNAQYAIGGSVASMIYGEPRHTYDIDLTIQIPIEQVDCLVQTFDQRDWYVYPEGIRQAVQTGGEFYTQNPFMGYKADFFATAPVLTPRQQRVLNRRQRRTYGYGNQQADFMSPEDVILYKLEWYQIGGTDKHLRDIRAMLTTSAAIINIDYIEQYVTGTDIKAVWDEIRSTLT